MTKQLISQQQARRNGTFATQISLVIKNRHKIFEKRTHTFVCIPVRSEPEKMNKMNDRHHGGRFKKRNTSKMFSRKLSCFKCLYCEIWSYSKVMDRLLQKYTHISIVSLPLFGRANVMPVPFFLSFLFLFLFSLSIYLSKCMWFDCILFKMRFCFFGRLSFVQIF